MEFICFAYSLSPERLIRTEVDAFYSYPFYRPLSHSLPVYKCNASRGGRFPTLVPKIIFRTNGARVYEFVIWLEFSASELVGRFPVRGHSASVVYVVIEFLSTL
jgi:hypothetical protein